MIGSVTSRSATAFGHGELAFPETPILERGGVVQRRVMRPDLDAPLVEHRVDEVVLGPAELRRINLDRVKMEDVLAAGLHGRER